MERCLELGRLPKARAYLKSVNFKRTTPGSVTWLAYANKAPNPPRVVDPSHPALLLNPSQFRQAFPWRTYPNFTLRVVPKGILDKPVLTFPDPPYTFRPARSTPAQPGHEQDGSGGGGGRQVDMSLLDVAAKELGGRVLRVNVWNKFKTAVALVVARGADVQAGAEGRPEIVFREEDVGGEKWILSDWTYICKPSAEMRRMPFHALVPAVRTALAEALAAGQQLEQRWGTAAASLQTRLLALTAGSPGAEAVAYTPNALEWQRTRDAEKMLDAAAADAATVRSPAADASTAAWAAVWTDVRGREERSPRAQAAALNTLLARLKQRAEAEREKLRAGPGAASKGPPASQSEGSKSPPQLRQSRPLSPAREGKKAAGRQPLHTPAQTKSGSGTMS